MKVSFILDGSVKLLANSSPGITACYACRAVLSLTSFIDSPEEMWINDVFRQLVAKCLKIQFKIAICLWCVDTTLVHHLRRLFYARTIQRSVFSGKRTIGQEDCDENEWNSSCCLKKHVEAKLKYTSGLHSSVLYCSVAVCQFGQMRAVSEDHRCLCVSGCVFRPVEDSSQPPGRGVLSMQGLSYGVVRVDTEERLSVLTVQDVGTVTPGGTSICVCVCCKRKCGWAGVTEIYIRKITNTEL